MPKKTNCGPSASVFRDDGIVRRVIARFSRGNIRMQRGAFLTREELDRRAGARKERLDRLRRLYGVRH